MKRVMNRAIMLLLTICGVVQSYREAFIRPIDPSHTGAVTALAVDAAQRFLVTCSVDKTAKIRTVSTGEPLRTLYPPATSGQEGRLYACAISPDGSVVALAGWTGWKYEGWCSVYIYETGSGRYVTRLGNLPNAVGSLAFSPDGSRLAVCLLGGSGVVVFDMATHRILMSAPIGGSCRECVFDRSGRLAVAADSGIHLFSQDLHPVSTLLIPAGSFAPASISFDPSGTLLAAGYHETRVVSILDGHSLAKKYTLQAGSALDAHWVLVSFCAKGTLHAVAVSGDPREAGHRSEIIYWPRGVHASSRTLKKIDDAVITLRALSPAGLVFGCRSGAWGLLHSNAPPLVYRSAMVDLSRPLNLLADEDGMTLAFKPRGGPWCTFSVRDQNLRVHPRQSSHVLDAVERNRIDSRAVMSSPAAAFRVRHPERLLTAGRVEDDIIVGTGRSIYRLTAGGAVRWKVPAPGPVSSLIVAGNVCVAALGDGTVRWFRVRDGMELLALAVDTSLSRWVLWDRHGNWNGFPGGEHLVAWYVGRGPDSTGISIPLHPQPSDPSTLIRALEPGKRWSRSP